MHFSATAEGFEVDVLLRAAPTGINWVSAAVGGAGGVCAHTKEKKLTRTMSR
jgi:hypothetical protein